MQLRSRHARLSAVFADSRARRGRSKISTVRQKITNSAVGTRRVGRMTSERRFVKTVNNAVKTAAVAIGLRTQKTVQN